MLTTLEYDLTRILAFCEFVNCIMPADSVVHLGLAIPLARNRGYIYLSSRCTNTFARLGHSHSILDTP